MLHILNMKRQAEAVRRKMNRELKTLRIKIIGIKRQALFDIKSLGYDQYQAIRLLNISSADATALEHNRYNSRGILIRGQVSKK